jgi:hypothetical protein
MAMIVNMAPVLAKASQEAPAASGISAKRREHGASDLMCRLIADSKAAL